MITAAGLVLLGMIAGLALSRFSSVFRHRDDVLAARYLAGQRLRMDRL